MKKFRVFRIFGFDDRILTAKSDIKLARLHLVESVLIACQARHLDIYLNMRILDVIRHKQPFLMLKFLAFVFLFFSGWVHGQSKNPYRLNKDIVILRSIESYKILNGFYAGDANSNCIYEFDFAYSLKVITYSCVRKIKPKLGTYKINESGFTIMVDDDTTTYEVVRYKGYHFFVEADNRARFANDIATANRYLKETKSRDHPVPYLRDKYFYKKIGF